MTLVEPNSEWPIEQIVTKLEGEVSTVWSRLPKAVSSEVLTYTMAAPLQSDIST